MTRTVEHISKGQQLIAFIFAILPALIIGFLITQNWVNVPKVDQWNTPGSMLVEIHEGKLTLDDWFSLHNENRLLVYRLISVPLAFLTHWDTRYEIILMFLIACGISLSFYRLIQLTCNYNPKVEYFIILAINLLIFSPIQVDVTGNWLRGDQLVVFLVVFCLALCVLTSYAKFNLWVRFSLCVMLSLVSTFTFASGMLCWLVGFPPLVILSVSSWREVLKRKNLFFAWCSCFVVTLYIYFHDYQKPPSSSNPIESLAYPFQAFLFFLSFLGSPLGFRDVLVSQAVGLVLLLMYVATCCYLIKFRSDFLLIERAIGWLTFSFYSLLSGTLVTLGRFTISVFGTPQSLYAKYTTPSLYFIVSIIGLTYLVISHYRFTKPLSKYNRLLKPALIFIIIAGLVLHSISFFHGIRLMKEERLNLLTGKACLTLVNVVQIDDCIKKHVYPLIQIGNWNSVDYIKDSLPIFSQMGLFSPRLITSSKIQDINTNQSLSNGNGVFESLKMDSSGIYVAGGSLVINQDQNIGGVVLAYGDPSDATIFAIADLVLAAPLNLISDKANMVWQVKFSANQLPTRPDQVTAWAIDTDTGKMFKLRQSQPEFTLPSNPAMMR